MLLVIRSTLVFENLYENVNSFRNGTSLTNVDRGNESHQVLWLVSKFVNLLVIDFHVAKLLKILKNVMMRRHKLALTSSKIELRVLFAFETGAWIIAKISSIFQRAMLQFSVATKHPSVFRAIIMRYREFREGKLSSRQVDYGFGNEQFLSAALCFFSTCTPTMKNEIFSFLLFKLPKLYKWCQCWRWTQLNEYFIDRFCLRIGFVLLTKLDHN